MTSASRRGFLKSGTAMLAGVVGTEMGTSATTNLARHTSDQSALPEVRVHAGGHLLETTDGAPFFWLGDTAWQLIAGTTREECSYYLHTRARQGFRVIQTVVLAENDGLRRPTALGHLPFAGADPRQPNAAYFERVHEIVREAASVGLYVALVPVWGDKLTAPWGSGPRIFRNDNPSDAQEYARFLGAGLRNQTNVVWVLGGDRPARLTGLTSESMLKRAKDAGFSPQSGLDTDLASPGRRFT